MKVVTNIQVKSVGGIVRALSSLASFIVRKDVPIEFVGLAVSDAPDSEVDIQWQAYSNAVMRGWSAHTSDQLWNDTLARSNSLEDMRTILAPLIAAYADRLRVEKPDVVFINGTYYRPWCLLQAARSLGLPVVLYYHGSAAQESTEFEERVRGFVSAIESDFADPQARYIFPSQLARDQAALSFPCPPERCFIIPNGVPDVFFNVEGSHDPRKIGLILRWVPIKNIAFVEEIVRYNAVSAHPYELALIVADILPEQRQALTHPHTTLCPPVDAEALAHFYRSCEAIVCPSLFETYGNVAAEAIASGTPALVSRTMGVAGVLSTIGLERLVYDFSTPEKFFEMIPEIIRAGISDSEKRMLRDMVHDDIVQQRVCDVLLGSVK